MSQPRHTSAAVAPREPSEYEMVLGTRRALELLAGKWSVEVVYVLASGTRRHSEILYEVGEISKKTLTHTLRGLQRQGLIARHAYPEVPPRVEYSLTPLGWEVTGLLMTLFEWSAEHLPEPASPIRRPTAVRTEHRADAA